MKRTLASLTLASLLVSTPLFAQAGAALPWWKGATIYEIYPRSFQDSNGDGIGDLNGITQRLGYLRHLGVDAIWLTPMYPSPQVDFGYDIANYQAIDPQYGSMADFDHLLAVAKQRHIRVILDMVLNHTSDKDPWFTASRSSRTDPKRDWYIWRDPKGYTSDGKPIPPNNWQSVFGHSAWQWDAATKQFYYHRFYAQQPDLNWRNPEVEKAMFDVMRFWLDKGVAGFRLDAIPSLFEDPQLRDNPATGGTNAFGDPNIGSQYVDNLPEVHGVVRRMRAMVAKYPGDRVLIGETYLPNVAELNKWYGAAGAPELQLPMDMMLGFGSGMKDGRLDAGYFRNALNDVETKVGGNEPLLVFSNHDNVRGWDRLGDGKHNKLLAKIVAAMLLTSRGTAMMYYGEELGMHTQTPTRIEDVRDPVGRTGWPKNKGRDGERTPMQWTPGPQAGFSTNPKTWLPIESDYKTVNVQTEQGDAYSLLRWYQNLIQLRMQEPCFAPDAKMTVLMKTAPDVLAFTRTDADGNIAVVALNMGPGNATLDTSAWVKGGASLQTVLASNAPENSVVRSPQVSLPSYSVWIAKVMK